MAIWHITFTRSKRLGHRRLPTARLTSPQTAPLRAQATAIQIHAASLEEPAKAHAGAAVPVTPADTADLYRLALA
jgi:hypothetical protein